MSKSEVEIANEASPNGTSDAPGKPLIRKGVVNLLLITLFGIVLLAFFWDRLSLWWDLSRTREMFHSYRDDQALQLLRKTLLRQGPQPEITMQLVRAHRRLGNIQAGLLLAQTAAKQGANSQQVELEQRLLLVQSGRIRGFDQEFTKLVMSAEGNGPDILQAYVLGLFANLRTDEAFGLLDGWAESSPNDAMPHLLKGYLYHGLNRFSDAAECYRRGLELAPYLTTMRRRLAQVLFDSGEYPSAQEELAKCQQEERQDAEVFALLAQCSFAENDLGNALAEADRALEIDPGHLTALRLRGQINLGNGDFQSALRDLDLVVRRAPDDLVAGEALARTLQALGRSADAKQLFDYVAATTQEQSEIARQIRQVLRDPQNVELRFEIATRLLKFGNQDDGARWLRTVLEIDPQHRAAQDLLENYNRTRGGL